MTFEERWCAEVERVRGELAGNPDVLSEFNAGLAELSLGDLPRGERRRVQRELMEAWGAVQERKTA